METGLYYFKIVNEEKSIKKAAEKLFVSQQAVSDQLHRLEKKYDEKLYVARPQFALTAAGNALMNMIHQISILEDDLSRQLSDIKKSSIGNIRFGIHVSRLRMAFASVMEQFHLSYPRVSIEIVNDDTLNLTYMLMEGSLDVIFGVNPSVTARLREIPLGDERILVAANEKLLKKILGYVPQKTLSAPELAKLPVIINPGPSILAARVKAYFEKEGQSPDYLVSVMSFELQLQMAERGIGVAFCPEQVVLKYLNPDQGHEDTKLVFLTAQGMTEKNHLALLTYRNAYQPEYMKLFLQLLTDAYQVR